MKKMTAKKHEQEIIDERLKMPIYIKIKIETIKVTLGNNQKIN